MGEDSERGKKKSFLSQPKYLSNSVAFDLAMKLHSFTLLYFIYLINFLVCFATSTGYGGTVLLSSASDFRSIRACLCFSFGRSLYSVAPSRLCFLPPHWGFRPFLAPPVIPISLTSTGFATVPLTRFFSLPVPPSFSHSLDPLVYLPPIPRGL